MDKFASIIQFALCMSALCCLVICIAIQLFFGHVNSLSGYFLSMFLFVLTGLLARIAYKEMRDEFRK